MKKITDEIAKKIGEVLLNLHSIEQHKPSYWCWNGALAQPFEEYLFWLKSPKGLHVIECYIMHNEWNITQSYIAHTKEWVCTLRKDRITGGGESAIKSEAILLAVYQAIMAE